MAVHAPTARGKPARSAWPTAAWPPAEEENHEMKQLRPGLCFMVSVLCIFSTHFHKSVPHSKVLIGILIWCELHFLYSAITKIVILVFFRILFSAS
jgi:hypothetical protein